MKLLLAIFIFVSTASDPWIDMLQSGEIESAGDIHISETSNVGDQSSPSVVSHDHKDQPCHEDDCTECHSCHLGHCGLLIPVSLETVRNETVFLPIYYNEQISTVEPKGLYRPPKVLI